MSSAFQVVPFLFENEATIRVIDRAGQPWFVGKDVAGALGYRDTAKAVAAHCKRAVQVGVGDSPTPSPEGLGDSPSPLDPKTKLIPEGDVFRLILRSTLPAAQRFERWLMEEVLPAIRRGGAFLAPVAATAETVSLRLVTEARQTFGCRAAAELWFQLGLPVVPSMRNDIAQPELPLRQDVPAATH